MGNRKKSFRQSRIGGNEADVIGNNEAPGQTPDNDQTPARQNTPPAGAPVTPPPVVTRPKNIRLENRFGIPFSIAYPQLRAPLPESPPPESPPPMNPT